MAIRLNRLWNQGRQGLVLLLFSAVVLLPVSAAASWWNWWDNDDDVGDSNGQARDVIFVGNNWEGTIDVIDEASHQRLGRINGIPDKQKRLAEITLNPLKLLFFEGIKLLIGEGNHQYVDDMYSSQDGRLLIVSRPSFAG